MIELYQLDIDKISIINFLEAEHMKGDTEFKYEFSLGCKLTR